MNKVYLLIGGNVGNRLQYLHQAARLIGETSGKITHRSAVYETAAWGKTDQSAFLNQALELETSLSPLDLLQVLLQLEEEMGRKRDERYGPRTIDIDILFFNDDIIHIPGLIIPHPELANRRFALEPLNEIAAGFLHPSLHKTIRLLLQDCQDTLPVKKFSDR